MRDPAASAAASCSSADLLPLAFTGCRVLQGGWRLSGIGRSFLGVGYCVGGGRVEHGLDQLGGFCASECPQSGISHLALSNSTPLSPLSSVSLLSPVSPVSESLVSSVWGEKGERGVWGEWGDRGAVGWNSSQGG